MATKNLKEKVAKFVEQEKISGLDLELLQTLRSMSLEDTIYWRLPPEKRNTLNQFLKELHDTLESGMIDGKFGASILIDSIIVTAFETGLRYGIEKGELV